MQRRLILVMIDAIAREAGLKVANIGLGMVRPEDSDVYVAPWWAGAFVARARDTTPEPADPSWIRVATHQTDPGFARACQAAGVPALLPSLDMSSESQRGVFGLLCDQTMLDWTGVLAASDEELNFITTEFLVTDTIQHTSGYKSEMAHWAIMQADMAVGRLQSRLRNAGVEDRWNIAVMSDHGHSPVERALHPRAILPGVTFQCEGQILLIAKETIDSKSDVDKRLADHDVVPFEHECLPDDVRGQVAMYLAPDGSSFEGSGPDAEASGPPTSISSHGLRPGCPGDDRFALFAGPDVPNGSSAEADAVDVMPTLAKLLGVHTAGAGRSMF